MLYMQICQQSSIALPLVHPISDTRSDGCTELQRLVKRLKYRDVVAKSAVKQGFVGHCSEIPVQLTVTKPCALVALQVCHVVRGRG